MRQNFNKPANEILLDLIYASCGILFRNWHLEFAQPHPLSAAPDWDWEWRPNTYVKVCVDEVESDHFEGSTVIVYRRVPVGELPEYNNSQMTLDIAPFHTVDLLPQINAKYRTQLTAADVINDQFTDPNKPVVLRMAPDSLCFIGQRVLPFVFTIDMPFLSDSLDLDGFSAHVSP